MYIKSLSVKNYRSLRNVYIGNLSPVVILYGENNSGKSNVLSFLEQVFKRKREYKELLVDDPGALERQLTNFWDGIIENFSDNFYKNTNEPIEFTVIIDFTTPELQALGTFPTKFTDKLAKKTHKNHLSLVGKIEQIDSTTARLRIDAMTINNKDFLIIKDDLPQYLTGFSIKEAGEALDIFDRLMRNFNDSFLRISPERFIEREEEIPRGSKLDLEPDKLKNWLFQTNLNRDTEGIFQEIVSSFEKTPFQYGKLSLARLEPILIELYIEQSNSVKLPIGRKGSGVQQVLMILSYVAMTKARFIGIEEPEINLSPKSQKSVYENLRNLVMSAGRVVDQVFVTTHSPVIARRSGAQKRGVWMQKGETQISVPSAAEIDDFFQLYY